tara:strand:+ start:92956 stop:93909 length:954 start_codon:yes stop_codon:yes gene_type:complete
MSEVHKGMQNKTIIKVIKNKIDDWVKSVLDHGEEYDLNEEAKSVTKAIKKDCIVTGGSIASMIMGEKINDFDVYLRTKESALLVANFYVDIFNKKNQDQQKVTVKEETLSNILGEDEERVVIWVDSSGQASESYSEEQEDIPEIGADIGSEEIEEEELRYRPVFLSENAITLSNKIQIVTRFYGEPDQIHRNYDFVHAMCYYDAGTNKLVTPEKALRSMQSRTLYYEGSLYPVCSLFRCRKFIKRGWSISAGEMLKIVLQISEIDLTITSILREQLTGVDALYFNQLISAIKQKEAQGEAIDKTYIVTVIDRIFNDL